MREDQYYADILAALFRQTVKKLWVVIILLIVLLVGSNMAWIYYESQWQTVETTTIEAQQESETGNNYAVGGDLIGEAKSKDYQDEIAETESRG